MGDDAGENGHGHEASPPAKRHRPPPKPITAADITAEFAHHDPAAARLNNGSFGACPASILAAQEIWRRRYLAQPDAFYFNVLQPGLAASRAAVAGLVGASDPSSIALVDNATTAAAVVLQHVSWSFVEGTFSCGDAVLMFHYAYGAVKKSILAYVARAGATVIEVPLPFPVASDDEIVSAFEDSLLLATAGGRRVRLAVIDHITSMPSVVVPVKRLVAICRKAGVDKVFVDGAHALGNVPINVEDIGADFYTSNLHKWYFCPPAVAFLHTRPKTCHDLHHPVVSHEYGNGLSMESAWIGTRDYSAQLVVPEVIDFVTRFDGGIEGIQKRNHRKVIEMAEMLATSWGTHLGAPPEMCCSMAMVGLPGRLGIGCDAHALHLRALIRDRFKVEVPIYYNSRREYQDLPKDSTGDPITGYARISHQVYNVLTDYERLREAIARLIDEGFTCSKPDL